MLISVRFILPTTAPAAGLALADIRIYLVSRNLSTGALANVWNPQNPTVEIGGGLYGRDYSPDWSRYEYFYWGQYTGVTVLNSNWYLTDRPLDFDLTSVWAYAIRTLTISLADFHIAQNGLDIEILRGDTLSLSLTYLGDISARSKLWFTVKEDKDTLDTAADIQIEETAGLVYINKGGAAIPANGSIVVTDAAAGNITITLAAVETAKLDTTGNFMYDVQMMSAAGVVTTLRRGKCKIIGDITRAVT